MIFLFPRRDMLVPERVVVSFEAAHQFKDGISRGWHIPVIHFQISEIQYLYLAFNPSRSFMYMQKNTYMYKSLVCIV